MAAPGRMRRLLVCDWLLLGVAAGAGFAAVEEILRRIAYLSAPSTPGLMLATALCPPGASQMLKCLGLPTFGLSPFSGSFPTALSYSGHAMVTGMGAACIGLGRHLWWHCGSRAGCSGGAGGHVCGLCCAGTGGVRQLTGPQVARTVGMASSRYQVQKARRARTSVCSSGCQFKAPAAALAQL